MGEPMPAIPDPVLQDYQSKLATLRFNVGRVRGFNTPEFRQALLEFQGDFNLPQTSVLDDATKAEIDRAYLQKKGTGSASAVLAPLPTAKTTQPVTPVLQAFAPPSQLFGDQPPVVVARETLPEAVFQAAGAEPSRTFLGSVMGAGLGGAQGGTGPLPGALGGAARTLFGRPWVPPGIKLTMEAHGPFVHVLEHLGRSLMFHLLGVSPRLLDEYRGAFDDGKTIQDPAAFRAHMLTLLRELSATVRAGPLAQAAGMLPLTSVPLVTPVRPDLSAVPLTSLPSVPVVPLFRGPSHFASELAPPTVIPVSPANAGYYRR